MKGSGWFAGSVGTVLADDVLARDVLAGDAFAGAFGASLTASLTGSLAASFAAGLAGGVAFFLRGGGALGTGLGPSSAPLEVGPLRCAFLAAEPEAARTRFRVDARVAIRLRGPRTGVRSMKTQPTAGTGLPPTSRPSSKSHSYSPWNSWNESFEKTVAPTRSAIS